MEFTMQEIAQMLGEKDLIIAQLGKQLLAEKELSESRLKDLDDYKKRVDALPKDMRPIEFPKVADKVEAKA
jgi:hypothetical protein